MSNQTVGSWIEEFIFSNPEWEEKLGPGKENNAVDLLKEIRDTGDMNMLSPDVWQILFVAFSLTEDKAKELHKSWIKY